MVRMTYDPLGRRIEKTSTTPTATHSARLKTPYIRKGLLYERFSR
ncbi:hypothetical protein LOY36_28225 [Pseudomonas sp. B21-019]|nr:hypothetical protein [Pseudomonas sp. B21-019]UVM35991.1 hypothetical protein LOY36_28225 [Pseudomonas sp. B21-019]